MKNSYKILLIVVMLVLSATVFFACKDNKDPNTTALATPQDIAANGSTISWSAVEGASSYEILVDNQEVPFTTTNVFYQLDLSSIGEYQIKIRAVGKNEKDETIYSEYAQYTFNKTEQLTKPVLSLTDKVVTWSAVENASSYSIKVESSTAGTLYTNENYEGTSFSFDDDKYTSAGKYTLTVSAIPNADHTEYANSKPASITYTVTKKLSAPAISGVSQSAVTWTDVSGSISYELKVYKVGDTTTDWPKTFRTTQNSYSFTNMGVTKPGKYYCTVKAIGDGDVYQTSDEGARDTNFDLNVVDTLVQSSVDLAFNTTSQKWELTFTSKNIDLLSDFIVTLRATKANNTSALTVPKTVQAKSIDGTYVAAEGDFNDAYVYYRLNSTTGYIKNTEVYKSNETYYTFDGVGYHEATGIAYLENTVEYYIHRDAAFYEKVKGTKIVQVQEMEAFNSMYTYYTDAQGLNECKGEYVLVGNKAAIEADTTRNPNTYYLRQLTADPATYEVVGQFDDITSTTEEYWVYKSFYPDDFMTGTYYRIDYGSFDADDYAAAMSASNIYVLEGTYVVDIDELFYKDQGGTISYTKSDESYYGNVYSITIKADATNYSTIPGDDVSCAKQYMSYKIPTQIETVADYENSKFKSYFDSSEEYGKFITKYGGYYAIQSLGDLQYINRAKDQNYVLLKDLDGSNYYWNPINEFTGIFDGFNHKIENLVYIPVDTTLFGPVQGLFGTVSEAEIRNVYLLGITNKEDGISKVGGIAGVVYDDSSVSRSTKIENCYVQGTLKAAEAAGGIVGMIEDAYSSGAPAITNCQTDVAISNSLMAGGIVGDAMSYAGLFNINIANCISTGDITSEEYYISVGDIDALKVAPYYSSTRIYVKVDGEYVFKSVHANTTYDIDQFKDDNGKFYSEYFMQPVQEEANIMVGGLVGAGQKITISNSFTYSQITIDNEKAYANVGGVIGRLNNGSVTNTYAGDYTRNAPDVMDIKVEAKQSGSLFEFGVGGFAGYVVNATITNCYSTIRTSATDNFSGFIGYIDYASADTTVENCYATGMSTQAATHKGAIVGACKDIDHCTFTNCYYEDYFHALTNQEKANLLAGQEETLSNIRTACGFATIEGYIEPSCVGTVYTDGFTEEIHSGQKLETKVYLATDASTVINLNDNDQAFRVVVGNNKTKGTCLYVLQRKTVDDKYDDDYYSGQRIVILVTVK